MSDTEKLAEAADSGLLQPRLVVHLGDLYADSCSVCGCHAYYGIASTYGPEGCVEAVKSGQVFCEIHLHNV